MTHPSPRPAGPRWWPALWIALVAGAAVVWVWWSGSERSGQERVFLTLPILLGSVVLLAIWLIFFSRLERRLRRRTIGALVVLIATGAAALRVRGVTGDFVPVLEWRWAPRAEPAAELLPQPNVPPAATPAPAAIVPPPLAPPDPAPNPEPSTAAPVAAAAEFPQFLGPDRNGAVTGVHLAKDWTARSPRLLWRRRVGTGWSGFAVANGLAVTQEQRGDREMVIAYNLSDGLPRWSHGDIARFESTIAGDGPRATPTISRGRVFTLGSTGLLNCLDLETGKRIWRRDIGTDNDARQPEWGRSSSPLAVDDLVIVSAGGSNGRSLVAYHRESGEPVWRAGDDLPSYSSPVVATLAGLRQIVVLNQSVAAGHDLTTGRILWEHSWPRHQPSVAAPLILPGNRVLLSSGYGYGSRLLGISAGEAGLRESLLWGTPRLKAKFTNLVAHEGFVYGLDDGVLVCLDPADGERRWKSGRYGHGQAILAGKLLLVQTEDGDIVLVEPRPDEHRELTRFTAFSQKTWNPPALAGRLLLVRNDVEAACYELPIESR